MGKTFSKIAGERRTIQMVRSMVGKLTIGEGLMKYERKVKVLEEREGMREKIGLDEGGKIPSHHGKRDDR